MGERKEEDLGEETPSLSEEIATFGCYANFAARKVRGVSSPNPTSTKNLSHGYAAFFGIPVGKVFVFWVWFFEGGRTER